MSLIDVRLRYLAAGQTWPVYWRDVKTLAGRATGSRYRVDFLGTAGIGKTTFIAKIADALGERVPSLKKKHPLPDAWGEAFNLLYSTHFAMMSDDALGFDVRHSKTLHLSQVLDLEHQILRSSRQQIVINGVGIIRHRLAHFRKLSAERPDFVAQLLSDRVVINCVSRDSVARAVRGKKSRGDKDAHEAQVGESVARKVEKIARGVDAIKALGVAVLDVDMDRPTNENIALVARFLSEHGMTSRAIEARAKKAPQTRQ